MKKVIKVSDYLYEGTTFISILYRDESLISDCLEIDSGDDIFALAVHTEEGHEIDFKYDEEQNIIWFNNATLGAICEAEEAEEISVDDKVEVPVSRYQRPDGIKINWKFWIAIIAAFLLLTGLYIEFGIK